MTFGGLYQQLSRVGGSHGAYGSEQPGRGASCVIRKAITSAIAATQTIIQHLFTSVRPCALGGTIGLLCGLVTALTAPAQAQTWVYPADISPPPLLAYGTVKLSANAFNQSLTALNQSTGQSQTFGFNNNIIDRKALQTFLGTATNTALVSTMYQQAPGGGPTLTCSTGAVSSPFCPSIWWQPVGPTAGVVFAGDSSAAIDGGAFFGMHTATSFANGPTAKDWAVIAVVQPSSSLVVNQELAPGVNDAALFHLYSDNPSGSTAELVNAGNATGNYLNFGSPGWEVTDGVAYGQVSGPNAFVQANTIVIAAVSRSSCGCVEIFQNGRAWSVSSQSTQVLTADQFLLGYTTNSVEGPVNLGWGGAVGAIMVYSPVTGIPTDAQISQISVALAGDFGIDLTTGTYASRMLMSFGDSINADYHPTVGLYGYMKILQSTVKSARLVQWGIPGSTITPDPSSPLNYSGTERLINFACPLLDAHMAEKSRVVLIHGGGNDFGIAPANPATAGDFNGTTTVSNIQPNTSALLMGQYISAGTFTGPGGAAVPVITTPTTIANVVDAHTVTLSSAAAGSATGATVQITSASASPTNVMGGIQQTVTTATNCGATTVIVVLVLKRGFAVYQPLIDSLNALIKANITGATIVDCTNFGQLGTNPGSDYSDGTHPSSFPFSVQSGAADMAACLRTTVNNAL